MHLMTHSESKLALGGDVDLVLVSDLSREKIDMIFVELWLEVFQFEKRCSRFIATSELSRCNRMAGEWVDVSPEFYDVLSSAKSLAEKTDGLFNPFILPMLQRTGYRKSFVGAYVQDYQEDYSGREVVHYSDLMLRGGRAKIPQNSAIDLGGCGKGYLADKLSAIADSYELHGYWLSVGGDLVGHGTDEYGAPWKVAVQDALHPDEILPVAFMTTESKFCVATSGVIERKGTEGKRRWHHLIDPRTSFSAETDILLASVMAQSAIEADVLASCAVIVGSHGAQKYLSHHGVSSFIIQAKAGGRAVKIELFGNVIEARRVEAL